ncbi:MAG: peptidoglycan -binding protein [Pseudomonadota bacterium]|nr:peptidoglycan -binding protein [Pseudomonadota bacterium]MEC8725394.1 peptidoglycan -binding protein [Pseudomonadota bacterium]
MPGRIRRQRQTFDIWPGFVDALSALLIVIIFLLMVFTLSQFFLGDILSGRNQALERVNQKLTELSKVLSLEQETNLSLSKKITQLTTDLEASTASREKMSVQLAELITQRDALQKKLTDARQIIGNDKKKIETQLAEIIQINRDITALKDVRAALEKKVSKLAGTIAERDRSLGSLRDRSKELETRMADAKNRTALAQKEIEKKELTIRELSAQAQRIGDDLTKEQRASKDFRRKIAVLNNQLVALRLQLTRLNAALEASETRVAAQDVQIVSLGKRLNEALASKVEELARYRSEFFGRLREALGKRSGVRIVGDRFVLQSEVLFSTGSADLNPIGQEQIDKLAATLQEISDRIPDDLNWVLRVDGHTDNRPISTPKFPSNWELSAARAISVVKALINRGLQADRLVAAGFGEFQPLDARNDEVAYLRNRRIEFKLTQR